METVEQEEVRSPGERIEEILAAFETTGAVGPESDATYRFELEGDDGGTHLLKVSAAGVTREQDTTGEADVSIKLSVADFLAIADGNFDGRLAVASERIEISGDLDIAEALLGWVEAAAHGEE